MRRFEAEKSGNPLPENQVEIDRAIENLCRGKTVVIVAHRLGAIKLCTRWQ